MSSFANKLAAATIPAFKCPPGTKMRILNLGILNVDEAWLLRGVNGGSRSDPNPTNKRRDLALIAGLIDHPTAGLILFETGCAEDVDVKWGAPITDVFPRTTYNEEHKLPAAIKAAGYDIKDVKKVVIGHLHLDHAGGLEHFVGTKSESICPSPFFEEFKHACWAVATEADLGVYLGHYMDLEKLNWQTFDEDHYDVAEGITLHFSPGHTPGLCAMQVNLEKDGTFIWTTDQFHVKENFEMTHPHGWLTRDYNAWVKSTKMIAKLKEQFNAKLIYGHDLETVEALGYDSKTFE